MRALQLMDLPLREIKKVLEYEDLEKIVEFLKEAEKRADEKIAALQYSRSKIRLAREDYEKKLRERSRPGGIFLRKIPERVILLSDTLEAPTLDNLWNYLSHFYRKISPDLRDRFSFEDLAGIYTENGAAKLFAVCVRWAHTDGLKVLPGGTYLCADCTEENREQVLEELIRTTESEYGADPAFTVQLIVVSGILRWNYEAQILIGN